MYREAKANDPNVWAPIYQFYHIKSIKWGTSCLYLPHHFAEGHHSALHLTLLRHSGTKIAFILDIFIVCAGEGACAPTPPTITAKDALNSCGEGNLGRSAQLFYFLLLAPVEEPPAKSQLLTCFLILFNICRVIFCILLVSWELSQLRHKPVVFYLTFLPDGQSSSNKSPSRSLKEKTQHAFRVRQECSCVSIYRQLSGTKRMSTWL